VIRALFAKCGTGEYPRNSKLSKIRGQGLRGQENRSRTAVPGEGPVNHMVSNEIEVDRV